MVVGRTFSGGVAIRYVLPVLLMPSRLLITDPSGGISCLNDSPLFTFNFYHA